MSYKVKALYLSGVSKKVHKSGEVLEVKDIPGGAENAAKLVKSGHLVDMSKGKEGSTEDGLTEKEQATVLIEESNVLRESGDLLGALEKLEAAVVAYPNGKTAPKLIKEIQEVLGED
jgi:hypothetical protein